MDSELGPIPEGWAVLGLATLANVVMGSRLHRALYNRESRWYRLDQGVVIWSA